MVDHTPDQEEERCILATILALRNVGGSLSASSHDNNSSRRRRHDDDENNDGNNSAADDAATTEDKKNNNKNGIVMMNNSDYNSTNSRTTRTFLPDAVIHHGILSYRPFHSFRVVLIRGDGDDNCSVGGGRKKKNNNNNNNYHYTLIFRSNRGNIRFRVTELPYLPPCRHRRSNSNSSMTSSEAEEHDTNHNDHHDHEDDMIYQNADGIIISCYLTKFFEYCDYYGYTYASSSIVNDVTARIEAAAAATAAAAITEVERGQSKKSIPTVVLCGNEIDVTHIDTKVSSVVFHNNNNKCWNNDDTNNSISTNTEGVEVHPQSLISSLTTETIHGTMCSSSFIDIPRHPFASLVRNITNDQGLEFLVVNDTNIDDDDDDNCDMVMNYSTCTTTTTCMGIMEDVEMIDEEPTRTTHRTTTTTTPLLSKQPPPLPQHTNLIHNNSNNNNDNNNNNMIVTNNNDNQQQHRNWDWLRSRIAS